MKEFKLSEELEDALMSRGHTIEDINNMDAGEMFDEYCHWNGLLGWGPALRRIMREASMASESRSVCP